MNKKIELVDITKQFLAKSTPGKGDIVYEDGLDIKTHKNEIITAFWILETFGGHIVVLKEKNQYLVKTPDYEWNYKLWELKKVESSLSLDKAIRKGFNQTKDRQGGVIVDVGKLKTNHSSIKGVILKRLNIIHKVEGIIIIKSNKCLLCVYEIKKGVSSR